MATMVLRVAGEPEDFDEGAVTSIMVHREPIALARTLARTLKVPELSPAIGTEAPVGWRFAPEDVPVAIRAIEATLRALDGHGSSLQPELQELRRALSLFRSAQSYARAVTLEV